MKQENNQGKLLQKLHDPYLFSDTEKGVVSYILEHPWQTAQISIGRLAEETFSSNSTILRICRKTGMNGFRQFKSELTRELEASKYVSRTVDFSQPFNIRETTGSIFQSMSSLYRNTVDVLQRSLRQDAVQQAADLICNSEHMFLYGVGDSALTCQAFLNKMMKIRCFGTLATENNDELHLSEQVTDHDCALFVTYSGKQAQYPPCIRILKENHVPVIAVTAHPESLIGKNADVLIVIEDREGRDDEKIATFYSQLCFSYVLNMIYSLVYVRKKK